MLKPKNEKKPEETEMNTQKNQVEDQAESDVPKLLIAAAAKHKQLDEKKAQEKRFKKMRASYLTRMETPKSDNNNGQKPMSYAEYRSRRNSEFTAGQISEAAAKDEKEATQERVNEIQEKVVEYEQQTAAFGKED